MTFTFTADAQTSIAAIHWAFHCNLARRTAEIGRTITTSVFAFAVATAPFFSVAFRFHLAMFSLKAWVAMALPMAAVTVATTSRFTAHRAFAAVFPTKPWEAHARSTDTVSVVGAVVWAANHNLACNTAEPRLTVAQWAGRSFRKAAAVPGTFLRAFQFAGSAGKALLASAQPSALVAQPAGAALVSGIIIRACL